MKECVLYRKEKNKEVVCLACFHKCRIVEGKFGICRVRRNIKGRLMLLVYGRVVAMHADPIEKKPLYHFLQDSYAFSIGTVGCNFKCDYCQNWDISQVSKDEHGNQILGEEIGPEKIVESALRTGCKSIAYTYNEPAIFVEFVKDCAVIAKKKGLKNILVTNGYFSKESFNFIKDFIDAANIDLKSFRDSFYNKFCGSRLRPVLENIKRFYKKGIHIEVTTLVIPGENDSDEELEDIAKFIASVSKDIPWHVTRFFPHYKMNKKDITSLEILKKAERIGKKYLKFVHIGNVF